MKQHLALETRHVRSHLWGWIVILIMMSVSAVHGQGQFVPVEGGFELTDTLWSGEVSFLQSSTDLMSWRAEEAVSGEDVTTMKHEVSFTDHTSTRFFRQALQDTDKTPPLITEFSLYMGIFHAASDGKLRVRYHVETELWNPYGFRLFQPTENHSNYERSFTLELSGMPSVTVTCSEQHVPTITEDMDQFSSYGPTDTRRSIWSWVEVKDHRLEKGEVYQLFEPFVASGFARLLGTERWLISTRPSDAASVTVQATAVKLDIFLKRFSDDLTVLELRNVPFDAFQYEQSFNVGANPFSHPIGGASYVVSDFDFGYHFRVADGVEAEDFAPYLGPGKIILDFDDPEVAALFEVTKKPETLKGNTLNLFKQTETFSDSTRGTHGGSEVIIAIP